MKTRKLIYISGLLLVPLIVTVSYAVTELQYFTAKSEPDAILLEWKTGIEDNLNRFEIERSATNPNNFMHIGSINAIGNNSYYFYRDGLNMHPEPPIYFYRLKLVEHNGNYVYSNIISVTHIISGVRSTWG
ncbi:MAG: hypothetical protein ACRDFC_00785, partial [Ignavibacteria bacterium]